VPKGGLEPPHPCEYMDLNHARLPIPPLRHGVLRPSYKQEHSNREPLVLQTPSPLSIPPPRKRRMPAVERLISHKVVLLLMTDQNLPSPLDGDKIPEDLAVEIRKLAHDLSNALEIIVQTSYLLSTTELKEPASDWLRMLDGGVQKALDLNLALRTYIKTHSP
jgi:hypothetical protein